MFGTPRLQNNFKIEELLLPRCAVRDGIVILTADYLKKSTILSVSL